MAKVFSPSRILQVKNDSKSKHRTFQQFGLDGKERRFLSIRRLPAWYLSWIAQMVGRLHNDDPLAWDPPTEKQLGEWDQVGFTNWGRQGHGNGAIQVPTMSQILGDDPYRMDDNHGTLHNLADRFMKAFTDRPVSGWIRQEFMEDDVKEFFRKDLGWSPMQLRAYDNANRINKVLLKYDHDVDHFFSPDEIKRLYENNPLWTEAEEQAYNVIQ